VDVDALATALVAAIDGLGIQLYFDPEIEPARVTAVLGRLLHETLEPESK
jgi:hypothetical protein